MRVALKLYGSVRDEVWEDLSAQLEARQSLRYCVSDTGDAHWYVLLDGEPAQVEKDIATLTPLGRWERIDQRPFEQCPHAKLMPLVYESEPVMAYCLARGWQRCRAEGCEFCPEFPAFYDPQTVIELEYEGYWRQPDQPTERQAM